jgi:signal transduction histidine kinase
MDNESTNFRVDLRLLQELGERLISRDEIAIVELVKNSYDADAELVTVRINDNQIIIEDDGDGMGSSELDNGWLTIGTSLKTKKSKSKSGRTVLGKKGVGRLAVLRLGKTITLISKQIDGPVYQLAMSWAQTREQLENSSEYTSLDSLKVFKTKISKNPFLKGKGTKIIIDDLNSSWKDNEIEKVRIILSKLIEPRIIQDENLINAGILKEILRKGKLFDIKFFWNNTEKELAPPDILENPHYYLDVDIRTDGTFSGQIKWNLKKGRDAEIIGGSVSSLKILREKKDNFYDNNGIRCGAFSFRLNAWDLDADEIWGSKNLLKKWSGISLVRDGFSVIQPEIDWLGLDLRRVQNPTKRMSTNQVRGVLYISSDENPHLIDKTDREGLISSHELQVLVDVVGGILDILERKRYDLRRDKTISTGYLLSRLNENTPVEISKNKNVPDSVKTDLQDFSRDISKFKKSMEEWMLSRNRMASFGILGARLLHESNHNVTLIAQNYLQLEEYIDKVDISLAKRLKNLYDACYYLSTIYEGLNPFVKFDSKKKEEINVKGLVEFISALYSTRINSLDIQVHNYVDENIVIRSNRTDISIIFANLFDNSVYWLQNTKDPKIIEIRAFDKENFLLIQFADNGPGIDPSVKDTLFDTGVTAKPEGFGLGLAIVKDFVDSYGGSIISGEDPTLGGALFEIQLPFKR